MSPPTADDLRKRIHCLFGPSAGRASGNGQSPPDFWIQPDPRLRPPRGQSLNQGGMTEDEWLDKPNPAFSGKTPNQLLRGCDSDRETLANAICAVEDGAFS